MKRDDDEMRKLLGNGEQVTAVEKQGPEPSGNAAHPSDLARAVAKAVEVELSDAWVDERAPDIAGVVDRTLGKAELGVASPLVVEAERLCALAEEHDAKAHRQSALAFGTNARVAWPALAKVTRALLAENERLRVVSPQIIDVRAEQQSSAALRKEEEPFAGRYYGAVNIDGDNPAPLFLFDEEGDCWAEIKRRQALPEDDDNRLSEDWQALAFDIAGLFWNSYDPNPRPAPTSRMWEMQREIERLEAKLLAKLREREQRVLDALRAYHAGADRGELKALLDEIWGPTPGKEVSGNGSVEQTAVKRTVAEVTDEEIVRAVARGGLGDLAEALGCHLWDGEGPLYDRIGALLRRGVLEEPCCTLTLSTAECARRIAARLGCFDRAAEIAAVLKGEEG